MYLAFVCCLVVILNLIYNLYLFVRIFFLNNIYFYFFYNVDLLHREISLLIILLIPIILGGIYFNYFLMYLNDYIIFLIYTINY